MNRRDIFTSNYIRTLSVDVLKRLKPRFEGAKKNTYEYAVGKMIERTIQQKEKTSVG